MTDEQKKMVLNTNRCFLSSGTTAKLISNMNENDSSFLPKQIENIQQKMKLIGSETTINHSSADKLIEAFSKDEDLS